MRRARRLPCRSVESVSPTSPVALLVTGTVGAGKTTTATVIGDELGALGVAYAVIDLDWLRRSWPTPQDDPFNLALELENLRVVARNFLRAGAQRLVLAGVLESQGDREKYERAVGIPLIVCRLKVDLEHVQVRLKQRHLPGRELDWHLARSGQLDEVLQNGGIGEHVVAVAGQSPDQVARAVLAAVDWL